MIKGILSLSRVHYQFGSVLKVRFFHLLVFFLSSVMTLFSSPSYTTMLRDKSRLFANRHVFFGAQVYLPVPFRLISSLHFSHFSKPRTNSNPFQTCNFWLFTHQGLFLFLILWLPLFSFYDDTIPTFAVSTLGILLQGVLPQCLMSTFPLCMPLNPI